MQILNKRVLTQAVVASTLLFCSNAVLADTAITTALTATQTLDLFTAAGPNVTFAGAGSVVVVGGNALVVNTVTGGPVVGSTINITPTSAPIGLSSDTASALVYNPGANALSTTLNLGTGGVVIQSAGAASTVLSTAGAGGLSLTVNNSGTIRNTGSGSAFTSNGTTNVASFINSGTISTAGVGTAVDLNLHAAIFIPTFTNSGTISSVGGSAITSTAQIIVNFTNTGTISGVTNVVNMGAIATNLALNGGALRASLATNVAAITAGTITIGANNVGVTGILRSSNAGAAAINVNPGAGFQFTTNGNLDLTNAAGGVTVTSGTLNLRNNIVNSVAAVNGGLTVAATGNINVITNQTISGVINLGAIGSKATFDLTNSAVAPVFGQLLTTVAGSSIAGATITVTNLGNGYIANNTSYKIIDTTGGGLTRGAAVVNVPSGASFTPTTGSTGVYTYNTVFNLNDLTITVARRNLNTFGNDDVVGLINGVGTALESIGQASVVAGAVPNADMMLVLGNLGRLPSADAVTDALRQLVPPTNQMTMQGAVDSTNKGFDVVNNRLSLARAGVDDETGYAAGDANAGQAVWGQVFGNRANQKKRKGIFGYKSDNLGLAFGTDMMVAERVRVGMAGSYASNRSKTKSQPSNENDMKSYQFTLYSAYDLGCAWWDGMVSYAKLRHKGTRRIQFGAINSIATNSHKGAEWAARVGYGYSSKSGNGWEVTPSASLGWNHVNERAYTEKGAAGLNLRVGRHSVDFLALGADIKFGYPMSIEAGEFVPDFHIGMDYDVISTREKLNATFVAGGPAFQVSGLEPARFGLDAGVGMTLMTKNRVSYGVSYDANMKKDYFSHAGFLNVRYAL